MPKKKNFKLFFSLIFFEDQKSNQTKWNQRRIRTLGDFMDGVGGLVRIKFFKIQHIEDMAIEPK